MLLIVRQCLLICYMLLSLNAEVPLNKEAAALKHPLHLSSTEINQNAKTGRLEISCRIFTDDFEDILSRNYKVKADLIKPARHNDMDAVVGKYLLAHLQLAANSRSIKLSYIGYENESEAIIVYLESEPVKNIRSLETSSTVLYDLFNDQVNIFHITCQGNRKSAKLDYPSKKLVTTF